MKKITIVFVAIIAVLTMPAFAEESTIMTFASGNTNVPDIVSKYFSNNLAFVQEAFDKEPQYINIQDINGNTALHLAVKDVHFDIARFLIDHRADVNIRNNIGETPLIIATESGNADVVKYLVEHGADTGVRNRHGITPLGIAASNRNIKLVQILVGGGADVNAKGEDGKEYVKTLATFTDIPKYGKADFNYTGAHPLMIAALFGDLEIVKYLVEHGADVNLEDPRGINALEAAKLNNIMYADTDNDDIAKFLESKGAKLKEIK